MCVGGVGNSSSIYNENDKKIKNENPKVEQKTQEPIPEPNKKEAVEIKENLKGTKKIDPGNFKILPEGIFEKLDMSKNVTFENLKSIVDKIHSSSGFERDKLLLNLKQELKELKQYTSFGDKCNEPYEKILDYIDNLKGNSNGSDKALLDNVKLAIIDRFGGCVMQPYIEAKSETPSSIIADIRKSKGNERDSGLLGFQVKLDNMDKKELRETRDILVKAMADPNNKDDELLGSLLNAVNKETDSREVKTTTKAWGEEGGDVIIKPPVTLMNGEGGEKFPPIFKDTTFAMGEEGGEKFPIKLPSNTLMVGENGEKWEPITKTMAYNAAEGGEDLKPRLKQLPFIDLPDKTDNFKSQTAAMNEDGQDSSKIIKT